MITPRLIVALPFCIGVAVHGFSVGRSSIAFRPVVARSTSTCLFADDAKESTAAGADDILNSPAFLNRKLEVIKSDMVKAEEELAAAIASLEEGKAEWGKQLDDLEKEYGTMQDRFKTKSSQGNADATIQVARRMLEVIDNCNRAFSNVVPETDGEKEIEADFKKAYAHILATFEELGIKEIETVGTEFDYEVHQAVLQKPSDFGEGIVCEELQKGYKFEDKLIRAAMVAVSF